MEPQSLPFNREILEETWFTVLDLEIPDHCPRTAVDHGYELVQEHLVTARIHPYRTVREVHHFALDVELYRYPPYAVPHSHLLDFARYPYLYRVHRKHTKNLFNTSLSGDS